MDDLGRPRGMPVDVVFGTFRELSPGIDRRVVAVFHLAADGTEARPSAWTGSA
jgi:hypothetical protein